MVKVVSILCLFCITSLHAQDRLLIRNEVDYQSVNILEIHNDYLVYGDSLNSKEILKSAIKEVIFQSGLYIKYHGGYESIIALRSTSDKNPINYQKPTKVILNNGSMMTVDILKDDANFLTGRMIGLVLPPIVFDKSEIQYTETIQLSDEQKLLYQNINELPLSLRKRPYDLSKSLTQNYAYRTQKVDERIKTLKSNADSLYAFKANNVYISVYKELTKKVNNSFGLGVEYGLNNFVGLSLGYARGTVQLRNYYGYGYNSVNINGLGVGLSLHTAHGAKSKIFDFSPGIGASYYFGDALNEKILISGGANLILFVNKHVALTLGGSIPFSSPTALGLAIGLIFKL